MAVAVVNKKQTGSAALATLAITSATAGNLLVVFIQKLVGSAPKGKDNVSGETGWTVNATSQTYNAAAQQVYVATKVAVGGETELNPSNGGSGNIQGLACFEVSGASETVDAIVGSEAASAKAHTSAALTTTDAGDIILAGLATSGSGALGEIEPWTGTGPMTNLETTSTRCTGGSYIPGTTLSAVTFTAHWVTARATGMLVIAIKPSGGETKTVAQAKVTGAGTARAPSQKIASANGSVTGAGKAATTQNRIALATGKVTGAGVSSASVSRIASATALVHGAGRATVTIGAPTETKVVSAFVHGAGRASASINRVSLATALVHGAGAPKATAIRISLATALVHGAGAVAAPTRKIALAVSTVTGGGRMAVSASRVASATALVHGGGRVSVTLKPPSITALVHGGGRATVTVSYFVPTAQFPAKVPIPGHVAVAQRGRLDRGRGHVATSRAGRSGI